MINGIAHFALLVRDYDEALKFYCEKLEFRIAEDTQLPGGKRWVRIAPSGSRGSEILLSKAIGAEQLALVGNQAGGRVLLFLQSTDLQADYGLLLSRGVEFLEKPRSESYGKVAVFKDLYGNRIDLIEPMP